MDGSMNRVIIDGSQHVESGLLKAKGQPTRAREEVDGNGTSAEREVDEIHYDRTYQDPDPGSGMPQPTRPEPSSSRARAVMRGTKSRDTVPELALRRAVYARGLRYRVDARPVADLRRTADLVFTKAKVAVFLDGCYWHACPQHYVPSKANARWWADKIERNRLRDLDTTALLLAEGWMVFRIWEHENPVEAAARIDLVVRGSAAHFGVPLNA
jgi:DNA mismatch endonuclease (patch repair protein)